MRSEVDFDRDDEEKPWSLPWRATRSSPEGYHPPKIVGTKGESLRVDEFLPPRTRPRKR